MSARLHRFAMPSEQRSRYQQQRGAAAVEFALTLVLSLVLVLGIVGFGFLTWANQRFAAMAGEGARVAVVSSFPDPASAGVQACARVQQMADDSALLAGVTLQCTTVAVPCTWVDVASQAQACLRLELSGDVSGWPLLRLLSSAFSMLGEGNSGTQGYRLQTQATVQIASNE